ncbi:MraZ protein [Raineyella antarctica]|uniref:Transcriptional regulator MraZ n=1 Tax=Raineyella antarctica TaxID=1577474 RepID=A0A1G6GE93_9ACTN|nr:division/cell wall cluster transcriptional repressor MraZ [Raineyella antarctica]SDB80153.1 MraZ protein [Raineyella antarctica]
MFLGTYTPKLDEKGRFVLPAKFREELQEGIVVARSQDRCLTIETIEAFTARTKELAEAPMTVRQVREYQRMLAATAFDQVPDKQGRVTIPPNLRSYAGLDKEIVVTGVINRLEIWDAAAWDEYSAEHESAFAEMNEDVFPTV